jgi:hypothetical protein
VFDYLLNLISLRVVLELIMVSLNAVNCILRIDNLISGATAIRILKYRTHLHARVLKEKNIM